MYQVVGKTLVLFPFVVLYTVCLCFRQFYLFILVLTVGVHMPLFSGRRSYGSQVDGPCRLLSQFWACVCAMTCSIAQTFAPPFLSREDLAPPGLIYFIPWWLRRQLSVADATTNVFCSIISIIMLCTYRALICPNPFFLFIPNSSVSSG